MERSCKGRSAHGEPVEPLEPTDPHDEWSAALERSERAAVLIFPQHGFVILKRNIGENTSEPFQVWMSSRRFTYPSSCSMTILLLGSLDRSIGSRIIRTA